MRVLVLANMLTLAWLLSIVAYALLNDYELPSFGRAAPLVAALVFGTASFLESADSVTAFAELKIVTEDTAAHRDDVGQSGVDSMP